MAAEQDVDQVIQSELFSESSNGRVLIEVGAARPDYLSISASFRMLGWTVVSVEPIPEFCDQHRSLGHTIYQYACGRKDLDDVDFYLVDSKGGNYLNGNVTYESFSSLGIKDQFVELYKTVEKNTHLDNIKVSVRRLDTILQQYHPEIDKVDVVAIDVEGWELDVMAGFDTARYCPKVVVLENLFCSNDYTDYMRLIGYKLWRRLEPNDVYVREGEG